MSEKLKESKNELEPKKWDKVGTAFIISIIALVISIGSMVITLVNNGGIAIGGNDGAEKGKVVISKQYDRGKSLEKAQAKNKPIVVFFYTDWCGFCQRFAPTFDKITKDKEIKDKFAVAYVNCENDENHKYMEEYEVQGYPTVYVIKEDGTKVHLENGTFFSPDSVKIVKERMLEIINE